MENITLNITGMNCRACEAHVTEALQSVQGVGVVSIDLDAKTATVRGENLNSLALIQAVEDDGYGVFSTHTEAVTTISST